MTHECLIEFPFLGVPSPPKQNVLKAEIGQETEQKIWTRNRKFGRNLCKLYNILICTYVYIYTVYTYTIPIYWKISTLTKHAKEKVIGEQNTIQIFNPCTCWQPEICGVIVVGQIFDAVIIPPSCPNFGPPFKRKLVQIEAFPQNGSFKTLANTRNLVDFALRTLPTIKHIDLKNDRNCPKMIWNVIETSQNVTNDDKCIWHVALKLAWFFTAAVLSCWQPLRSSTPAENSEKPGVSALGYNNRRCSSRACAAGRTNTTITCACGPRNDLASASDKTG